MENFDEILNQMRDESGDLKPNMHLLDEIVPVEEQIRYFKYSKYIQAEKNKAEADKEELICKLFATNIDVEDKRHFLTQLAAITDVAAYRAIETYHKNPLEKELAHWSALALIESRILLNTELSGEKQFFVSTGLGGKNGKLRYFSVVATESREDFNDFQRETILRELQFAFEQNKIEVESIDIKGNYLKLFVLCGLDHDPRSSIDDAIKEANLLGNFIDQKYLLTNIKLLDDKEIVDLLQRKETIQGHQDEDKL